MCWGNSLYASLRSLVLSCIPLYVTSYLPLKWHGRYWLGMLLLLSYAFDNGDLRKPVMTVDDR